jgi:putative ABC transport system ATP-binding protein
MTEPLLVAHNLHKRHGRSPALRGAEAAFHRAEIVAITGPSGSGKSTLLQCLAGIHVPDSGEVVYDGQHLGGMKAQARTLLRRSEFGFVYQFGHLVPELTAVENAALPLLLAGRGRAEALRTAHLWLERLGVDALATQLPGEMSGGESQRAAIARALVHEPRVIFADEPTGALDSLSSETVLEALVEIVRTQSTTLLLVTHEARVAAYANREIIVRDGVCSGL